MINATTAVICGSILTHKHEIDNKITSSIYGKYYVEDCLGTTCYAHDNYGLNVDGRFVKFIKQKELTKKDESTITSRLLISQNEKLEFIQSKLDLSITQMSELFGVTRKAIYDWFDGAEPRRNIQTKIETLIDLLADIPEVIDISKLKAVWKIPVSEKSFLAVFNEDNSDLLSYRTTLKEKLDELSPKLVSASISENKTYPQLGKAHIAEFDRRTDFT